MAADQGWLERPGRFLTPYATFGGQPDLWRKHHAGRADEGGIGTGDDREWRIGFLKDRIDGYRRGGTERYDSKAYRELSPEALVILRYLSVRVKTAKLRFFLGK